MLTLYENIKNLRKDRGWSQEELAKKMGYTDRSAIAKIESGSVDLSESKIMAFAKTFGVKPCVLMGWENTPAASNDDFYSGEALMIAKAYDEADEGIKKSVRILLNVREKEARSIS